MFKILRILIISVGIISSNTYATVVEKTDLGEQPFDVLPPDHVLTINDFMRMNKIIPMNRIVDICEMKKEISRVSDYINRLSLTLEVNNIDIEKFKESEFVNIECFDGNFAYEVMEESPILFQKLIDFGINFNRPITFEGKVGTFLDIALFRFKQLEGQDAVNLGTSIRKLKKLKFKTCKELSIKCSINS